MDCTEWTRTRTDVFWDRWVVSETDPEPGTYRFLCCSRVQQVDSFMRGDDDGLWGRTQHLTSCPTLGCDEKYPLMEVLVPPDD